MATVDDFMDALEQMKKSIEERVLDQARRHTRAGSHADWAQVVDIQIDQEKEKLAQLADEMEDQGKFQECQLVHKLVDEWLPSLAKEFRSRR